MLTGLNALPNLVELHCSAFLYGYYPENVTNQTITHLYTMRQPLEDSWFHDPVPLELNDQQMDDYVRVVKQYFEGLRLFRIEKPELIVEF